MLKLGELLTLWHRRAGFHLHRRQAGRIKSPAQSLDQQNTVHHAPAGDLNCGTLIGKSDGLRRDYLEISRDPAFVTIVR